MRWMSFPDRSFLLLLVWLLAYPAALISGEQILRYFDPNVPQGSDLSPRANLDSLYRITVHSENKEDLLAFAIQYPGEYFGALAASRYLLEKAAEGENLELVAKELSALGIPASFRKLYPSIQTRIISRPKGVYFKNQRFLTTFRENYSGQLDNDPQLFIHLDWSNVVPIPFDAAHLIARKQFYSMRTPELQFLASDSTGFVLAHDTWQELSYVLDDLSHHLQYSSFSKAFSKLFNRDLLLNRKLVVFIYDNRIFRSEYNLVKSGWDYPVNGFLYINPAGKTDTSFLYNLISQFAHLLIDGDPNDLLHKDNRWFDNGFADWVSYSYLNLQCLIPGPGTFQEKTQQERTRFLRKEAAAIFNSTPQKHIRLKNINQLYLSPEKQEHIKRANLLSASLIAYLNERYGVKRVLNAAARISRKGQDLTERSLKAKLGVNYEEIESGWNGWLQETDEKPSTLSDRPGI